MGPKWGGEVFGCPKPSSASAAVEEAATVVAVADAAAVAVAIAAAAAADNATFAIDAIAVIEGNRGYQSLAAQAEGRQFAHLTGRNY